MASLTKEQIRNAEDVTIEAVHVPEWGGDVHFRRLKANESERVFQILDKGSLGHPELVVLACCNEDGSPLFSADDLEWLRTKSYSSVQRIVAAIVEKHPVMMGETAEIEKN